jgi:hypothetical protein
MWVNDVCAGTEEMKREDCRGLGGRGPELALGMYCIATPVHFHFKKDNINYNYTQRKNVKQQCCISVIFTLTVYFFNAST